MAAIFFCISVCCYVRIRNKKRAAAKQDELEGEMVNTADQSGLLENLAVDIECSSPHDKFKWTCCKTHQIKIHMIKKPNYLLI